MSSDDNDTFSTFLLIDYQSYCVFPRDPLSVNLQSKSLARDLNSVIHGTRVKINNKGACW